MNTTRTGNCLDSQDISPKVPSVGDVLTFQAPGGWTPGVPSLPPGTGEIGVDVVYRPGGVAGGNVFITWATAYAAAIAAGAGPVTIGIDDSIVTPAPVDPGLWDMQGRILLQNADPTGGSTLDIPGTAQLDNFPGGSGQVTLQGHGTVATPSLLYNNPAGEGLTIQGGFTFLSLGPAPMVQVASGTLLQFRSFQAGLFGGLGREVFSVAAGGNLFTSTTATVGNPPTGLIAGAGNVVWGRTDQDSTLPLADVNFTGTLAISPELNGPANETLTSPVPTGAVTYVVDAAYTTGARSADEIIPVKPSPNLLTTIQLPDATLPMNKGRLIRIVDDNGLSGTPGRLRVTCPATNTINGVAGGPISLASAWGQWFVVGDGANWIVSEASGFVDGGALTQTVWFIDPQNSSAVASDSNNGLTAATPLRTIAEMARRLGTTQPEFASPAFTTVVTLMSDTNANDPWDFRPLTGTMVCTGTLTQQQLGQFNAFTARNQTAGTKASGGTASFASWVPFVGMLVQDTTAAPNAWFTVDADTGGGTATFTQPESDPRSNVGAVIPSMLTPGAADNFTIWRPSIVHMTQTGALGVNAQVILQNGTGTPVNANGQVNLYGGVVCQLFPFNVYVTATAQNEGNDPAPGGVNNGKPFFAGCALLKGCEMESHAVYGGSIASPFVLRAAGVQAIYGGGVLFNAPAGLQSFSSPGKHQFGDCGFFCTNLNLLGAGNGRQGAGVVDTGTDATPAGATPAVWGPSTWPMKSAGIHMARVSFAAELKVTGNVTLAGAANGFGFVPGTGLYTVGPTVVLGAQPAAAAAIDAAGGVFNPGKMCGMFVEA